MMGSDMAMEWLWSVGVTGVMSVGMLAQGVLWLL